MKRKLTLIELIITILVLGLLTALAMPQFIGVKANADVASLKNDLDVLDKAITEHYIKLDTLPLLDEAVTVPDGPLKDYIFARGDSTAELFKVDLAQTKKYHTALKTTVDENNYFIYSKKTGNVYHSAGLMNGDGKTVYGIKEIPFITLMGGKPLSSEVMNMSESTDITVSGAYEPGQEVLITLNDVEQTVTLGSHSIMRDVFAGDNTYSVNLTLIDNKVNTLKVKVGKTEEVYKILVGEVSDEEIIENTEGVAGTFAAAGDSHTLLLMEDGTVKAFGFNNYGQLGITTNSGTTTPNPTPTTIPGITGVKSIAAGTNHTLLLMEDGTVKAFGYNVYGQLGITTNSGTESPNPTPTTIPGITGVKSVVAGANHTLLLMEDGTVMSFGVNRYGQLGTTTNNNTGNPNPTPTTIPGITGVKSIAAGQYHTLLLMEDGTVKAFGYNRFGKLGIATNSGTESPNPVPTTIPGITGAKSIAAGYYYTLLLMEDGTVKAFGRNIYGQLGIAANSNPSPTPTTIPGITGVKSIAAGHYHTLLLMEDGTVKAFGYNIHGQLGTTTNNNTTTPNPTPTTIPGITGVKSVAAGGYHTLLLMEDGTVKAFGYNRYGQLGTTTNNNTTTPNPTPTTIPDISIN